MSDQSILLNLGPAVWLRAALAVASAVARYALGMPARRLWSAGARALLQLAVVAGAVASLSRSAVLSAGFLLLMLPVAAWTAARRIGAELTGRRGEVEAGLALGLPPRAARALPARA